MSETSVVVNYTSPSGNGTVANMTPRNLSSTEAILWYTQLYVIPVLIAIGLVGNILSFLVFMYTHLRRLSSTFYLAALSLADTGFLVQLFASWLSYVRVFIFHKDGWCQTFVYLAYVCSFLSVWFVVGFTAERYIAVCYPLKRQNMCTVARAKIVVFGLTIFALLAYSFGAWTTGIIANGVRQRCHCLSQYCDLVVIFNNTDTVITLIVPSMSIFIMNVRIIYKIAHFYEEHNSLSAGGGGGGGAGSKGQFSSRTSTMHGHLQSETCDKSYNQMTLRNRSQLKITKMLLIVSSIFLILNLPSHAIRIYTFFVTLISPSYVIPRRVALWQQAFTMVYYCNFVINFFLYSLCGKNFRKALCRLGAKIRGNVRGLAQRKYDTVNVRGPRAEGWTGLGYKSSELRSDCTAMRSLATTRHPPLPRGQP